MGGQPTTRALLAAAIALTLAATAACGDGGVTLREPPAIAAGNASVVVFQDLDGDQLWSDRDKVPDEAVVTIHDQNISIRETQPADRDGRVEVVVPDGVTDLVIEVDVSLAAAEGSDKPVPITVYSTGTPGSTTLVPLSSATCPDLDDCSGVLLPDLVALSELPEAMFDPLNPELNAELIEDYPGPSSWYLDRETQPGRTLLRIASLTANLGDGPLIVTRGAVTEDLSSAIVFQRLVTANGTYVDVETGSFTHHEGHDHVHLNAFEQLRLLDLNGVEVAASEKLSFCLTDVLETDRDLIDRSPIRVNLEPWQCSAYEQGINPGFADYYGASLDDQWIDVTSVPSGSYIVEFIADPDDVLIESDETNNVARLQIELVN